MSSNSTNTNITPIPTNYKNELITHFGKEKKCVTFQSQKIGGPSNAPIWYSWIKVNKQKMIDHQYPGSKGDSEQELSKKYLEILQNATMNYLSESKKISEAKKIDLKEDESKNEQDNYTQTENISTLNQLRKEEQIVELQSQVSQLQKKVEILESTMLNIALCLKTNGDNLTFVSNRLTSLETKK